LWAAEFAAVVIAAVSVALAAVASVDATGAMDAAGGN